MPKLTLIRGLPGSGKSTMAKKMWPFVHLEADMFFTDERGNYRFDASKIADAHGWCQHECREYLEMGADVVVSNTFTRKWEMQPYIDMATELGIPYEVVTATGKYPNVHGVDQKPIQRMRSRWEN